MAVETTGTKRSVSEYQQTQAKQLHPTTDNCTVQSGTLRGYTPQRNWIGWKKFGIEPGERNFISEQRTQYSLVLCRGILGQSDIGLGDTLERDTLERTTGNTTTVTRWTSRRGRVFVGRAKRQHRWQWRCSGDATRNEKTWTRSRSKRWGPPFLWRGCVRDTWTYPHMKTDEVTTKGLGMGETWVFIKGNQGVVYICF